MLYIQYNEMVTKGTCVGVDIVEVDPYLDHAELTQHIGVQLLLEAVGSRFPSAAAKRHGDDVSTLV